MITHHTQLLNALIEKYNLKYYLEIGVQNPENNFDKVNAAHKIGVDPEIAAVEVRKQGGSEQLIRCTSDDFFAGNHPYGKGAWDQVLLPKFNLVFIDGLHTAEQVKRDFENALACLSDNGFILIHDVLPENEIGTRVPRETRQWWGDIYKWAMNIRFYGLKYITYNIDNGCMVVQKNIPPTGNPMPISATWSMYMDLGKELMNVTDKVEV